MDMATYDSQHMDIMVVLADGVELGPRDHFDPLELINNGQLSFFHRDCAGGKITATETTEGKGSVGTELITFKCTACKASASIPLTAAVQFLRKIFLLNSDCALEDYGGCRVSISPRHPWET
jgi:hypothetical protein